MQRLPRIFNLKTGAEITFEIADVGIKVMPYDYLDDHPHVLIELHDIDWPTHAEGCPDCGALLNALGTMTVDWFFEYNDRRFRLDLRRVGRKVDQNGLQRRDSEYFTGTKMKLLKATDSIEGLELELAVSERNEKYEHCAFLRDRIGSLREG